MNSQEREIDILETLARGRRRISQRDLARTIGLSLGMTNSILKRLVQKGWLQVKKVNNRNIQYIISPHGMERIARRSYRYLRRTIKNVVCYKEAINDFARKTSQSGYTEIVLVGESDLDFVIEHVCGRNRLHFARVGSMREVARSQHKGGRRFLLFSESFPSNELQQNQAHCAYLHRLLADANSNARGRMLESKR